MEKLGFAFWMRLETYWKERCDLGEFLCKSPAWRLALVKRYFIARRSYELSVSDNYESPISFTSG